MPFLIKFLGQFLKNLMAICFWILWKIYYGKWRNGKRYPFDVKKCLPSGKVYLLALTKGKRYNIAQKQPNGKHFFTSNGTSHFNFCDNRRNNLWFPWSEKYTALVNQVFKSFLIEPYCVWSNCNNATLTRQKRGVGKKRKKEKPLDRSSTKGFSSSQSLNLTSQTKWIPFAWLLVGPLWWWKRIECIWWKTNVLLKMSGNLRNFCLEFKSYVFQSRVGIGIYQKYKKIQKFRILKFWMFQSRNFNTTKSQKLSILKS